MIGEILAVSAVVAIVLLSIAFLVARMMFRGACPRCGRPMRRGQLDCPRCGCCVIGRFDVPERPALSRARHEAAPGESRRR